MSDDRITTIRDQTIEPWERHQDIECVECPDCAFLFASDHPDADGTYSCPACAEIKLIADLAAAEATIEAVRNWFDISDDENALILDLAEIESPTGAAKQMSSLQSENERLRKTLGDVIGFVRTGGPLSIADRQELIAFVKADLAADG